MKPEPNTYSALGEVAAVHERRSLWTRIVIDLRKAPFTARFGMVVILAYMLVAIFAPVLAPYGEAEVFPEPYAPWSSIYIFGTDQIGRDIFFTDDLRCKKHCRYCSCNDVSGIPHWWSLGPCCSNK